MQSLRTRKASESRPRGQQRPPNKLARPGQVTRRATRVDDKIKKRMSMRYADISGPTDAFVPAVPTIPLALRAGGAVPKPSDVSTRERDQAIKEEQREAEMKMLGQEVFDPDACESRSTSSRGEDGSNLLQFSSSRWPTRRRLS